MTTPCYERFDDCPYLENNSCFKDNHHIWWPRKDYRTRLERIFRNLPEHLEEMCRYQHEELHSTEDAPPKPSRDFMLGAISVSEVYLSNNKRRELGL